VLIEYLPPSPKAGQQERKEAIVAEALLAAGFAKRVEDPNEKPQMSRHHVQPPYEPKPKWSIQRNLQVARMPWPT
jgi:hypothetical protein